MKQGAKQEIEVKLRVADVAAMRRLLRRLGGRVRRRVHEMNTLFDTPQGTLRKSGRLMRLREETALRKEGSGEKRRIRGNEKAQIRARYVLTFKGPGLQEDRKVKAPAPSAPLPSHSFRTSGTSGSRRYQGGQYKVRDESEFIVNDARAVLAVVGQAGMRPCYRYEKYRTSYRIPRANGVHVEVDETPAGAFLELEGSRRAIDRMARRLGYRRVDYITKSYGKLHAEDCRRRGVQAGDMVFRRQKSR